MENVQFVLDSGIYMPYICIIKVWKTQPEIEAAEANNELVDSDHKDQFDTLAIKPSTQAWLYFKIKQNLMIKIELNIELDHEELLKQKYKIDPWLKGKTAKEIEDRILKALKNASQQSQG